MVVRCILALAALTGSADSATIQHAHVGVAGAGMDSLAEVAVAAQLETTEDEVGAGERKESNNQVNGGLSDLREQVAVPPAQPDEEMLRTRMQQESKSSAAASLSEVRAKVDPASGAEHPHIGHPSPYKDHLAKNLQDLQPEKAKALTDEITETDATLKVRSAAPAPPRLAAAALAALLALTRGGL